MLVGDGSAQNRIGRRESTGTRFKQLMEEKNKDTIVGTIFYAAGNFVFGMLEKTGRNSKHIAGSYQTGSFFYYI